MTFTSFLVINYSDSLLHNSAGQVVCGNSSAASQTLNFIICNISFVILCFI